MVDDQCIHVHRGGRGAVVLPFFSTISWPHFGLKLNMLPMTAVMLVFIATVTYAAYRDIRLSSRVGLILEIISIGIVIVISALFVRVRGTVIDPEQLKIASFDYGGVFSALPFVIFSFVGFESSATLAKEVGQSAQKHTAGGDRLRRILGDFLHRDRLLDGVRHRQRHRRARQERGGRSGTWPPRRVLAGHRWSSTSPP